MVCPGHVGVDYASPQCVSPVIPSLSTTHQDVLTARQHKGRVSPPFLGKGPDGADVPNHLQVLHGVSDSMLSVSTNCNHSGVSRAW